MKPGRPIIAFLIGLLKTRTILVGSFVWSVGERKAVPGTQGFCPLSGSLSEIHDLKIYVSRTLDARE